MAVNRQTTAADGVATVNYRAAIDIYLASMRLDYV
jgi:hypothetical protein